MAKFDKDMFLSETSDKVKDAIESGLISQSDIDNNDVERLIGFLQYTLSEFIEDRKMAIDILRDFNYDERYAWSALEEQIGGEIKSLFDVALANLWKFLEASGLLNYAYYISGAEPESSKPTVPTVKYTEDEFEDEGELYGEINDDEFELDNEDFDNEDFDTEDFDNEDFDEENAEDVEESYIRYNNLDDEYDLDDYKYNELERRRNASQRRNFRRSR